VILRRNDGRRFGNRYFQLADFTSAIVTFSAERYGIEKALQTEFA
jgi:hypothetical protein